MWRCAVGASSDLTPRPRPSRPARALERRLDRHATRAGRAAQLRLEDTAHRAYTTQCVPYESGADRGGSPAPSQSAARGDRVVSAETGVASVVGLVVGAATAVVEGGRVRGAHAYTRGAHAYTHAHVRTLTRAHTHTRARARTYTHAHTHTHVRATHTHTHIRNTHTHTSAARGDWARGAETSVTQYGRPGP